MSVWLLAAVAAAYGYVAFDYWRNDKVGLAVAFVAYAISCIGFMIDQWRSS